MLLQKIWPLSAPCQYSSNTHHTHIFISTNSIICIMFIVNLFQKETLSGFTSIHTKDGSDINLQEMHVEDQYTPLVKCALQLPPPFDPQTSTGQHKIKTLSFHVNNLDRIPFKEWMHLQSTQSYLGWETSSLLNLSFSLQWVFNEQKHYLHTYLWASQCAGLNPLLHWILSQTFGQICTLILPCVPLFTQPSK